MGAVLLVLFLLTLGFEATKEMLTSLKSVDINVLEIILAKHITWYIVKGILMIFSALGIWLGSNKAKIVFSGVLFFVTITMFG